MACEYISVHVLKGEGKCVQVKSSKLIPGRGTSSWRKFVDAVSETPPVAFGDSPAMRFDVPATINPKVDCTGFKHTFAQD